MASNTAGVINDEKLDIDNNGQFTLFWVENNATKTGCADTGRIAGDGSPLLRKRHLRRQGPGRGTAHSY